MPTASGVVPWWVACAEHSLLGLPISRLLSARGGGLIPEWQEWGVRGSRGSGLWVGSDQKPRGTCWYGGQHSSVRFGLWAALAF